MTQGQKKSVLVLHGPNLNLLGTREPALYGTITLDAINQQLQALAQQANIELRILQSNHEGVLVDKLHELATSRVDYLIMNPAAFTHTSVALRDAISGVKVPFIEVHLSNVYARESFRHQSYFSDIATGVISGLGAEGYLAALRFIIQRLGEST